MPTGTGRGYGGYRFEVCVVPKCVHWLLFLYVCMSSWIAVCGEYGPCGCLRATLTLCVSVRDPLNICSDVLPIIVCVGGMILMDVYEQAL